ncbi:serine O-acetyltransferase [Microvirga tunisiensis]|uniref:Serine acetyltransferase n=1 Tax=Microvirga tunisiensis TaxID=2108360 RepID=A0A5N7MVD9_9HYPH|nr:serine O-acetyltransferase [Microvirga tunisiensis]MPR12984.1 serine acetyltransferase [Microvirga tunisiensis]MPR30911.1 serine acetyltransferase [Microvirga tunisiensis]
MQHLNFSGSSPVSDSKPEASDQPHDAIGFWRLIREDGGANLGSVWRPGFQAMVMYRIGRWAAEAPLPRAPALWFAKVLHVFIRNFYGIELYWDAKIGRRFTIGHQGGIVIHQFCTIGDDCMIRQNATIGAADHFSPELAPVIGNNVEIGAGATIIGKIRIGNNVKIGPNAVVTTDIPDSSTVFAPASRIVSWG